MMMTMMVEKGEGRNLDREERVNQKDPDPRGIPAQERSFGGRKYPTGGGKNSGQCYIGYSKLILVPDSRLL